MELIVGSAVVQLLCSQAFGSAAGDSAVLPCPTGLRTLQGKKELESLVKRVQAQRAKLGKSPPILVKIAPDLADADRQDVADVALRLKVDGLIVNNTTLQPPAAVQGLTNADETGGLSGRAMMDISTEVLRDMYKRTRGKVPIVGVGGVATGEDAYRKIRAGASLVQLYSSFAYQGPSVVPRVKRELAECLSRDGFKSVADAVGADHR